VSLQRDAAITPLQLHGFFVGDPFGDRIGEL
jgi:hypothetical protein